MPETDIQTVLLKLADLFEEGGVIGVLGKLADERLHRLDGLDVGEAADAAR